MSTLFLVIGVDQEGDALWDYSRTLPEAKAIATRHHEVSFDKPKIYEIDLGLFKFKERAW
jgi:hypothetical protein